MPTYYEKLPYMALGPLQLGAKVADSVGPCLAANGVNLDESGVCHPTPGFLPGTSIVVDRFAVEWMACKSLGSDYSAPTDSNQLREQTTDSAYKDDWIACLDAASPST